MASESDIVLDIQAKIGNKTVAQHLAALTAPPEAFDLKKEIPISQRHFHYEHAAIANFCAGLTGQPVHVWFFLSENELFRAWLLKAAEFLSKLSFSGLKKDILSLIKRMQPLIDLLYYFHKIHPSIVKTLFKLESVKAMTLDKKLPDATVFEYPNRDLSAYENKAREQIKHTMQLINSQETLDFDPKQWLDSLFNKPKHHRIKLQALFVELFKEYKDHPLLQDLYTSISNEKQWPIDWPFVLGQLSTHPKGDALYGQIASFADKLAFTGALTAIPNICTPEPLTASIEKASGPEMQDLVLPPPAVSSEMQGSVLELPAASPEMQDSVLQPLEISRNTASMPEMPSSVLQSLAASRPKRWSIILPPPAKNTKKESRLRSTTSISSRTTNGQSTQTSFIQEIGNKTVEQHLKALAFADAFLSKDAAARDRLYKALAYFRDELLKQPRSVLDSLQKNENFQNWLEQIVTFLPTLFLDSRISEPAVLKGIQPLIDLLYYFNETPIIVDALFRLEVVKEIGLDIHIDKTSLSLILKQTYASHNSSDSHLDLLFSRVQAQIAYKIRAINQRTALRSDRKQQNEALEKIPEICELELKIDNKRVTEHLAALDPNHILGTTYDAAIYFLDKLAAQPIHILDDLCNNSRFKDWLRKITTTLSGLLLDPEIFNPATQKEVEPLFRLLYYFNSADVTISSVLLGFEMIKAIPNLKKADKNIQKEFEDNYERSFGQGLQAYVFQDVNNPKTLKSCDTVIDMLFEEYIGIDINRPVSRLEQACYAGWLISRIKKHPDFPALHDTRQKKLNTYLNDLKMRYFSPKASVTPYYSINSTELKVPALAQLVKEKKELVKQKIKRSNTRDYSKFEQEPYYKYLERNMLYGMVDLHHRVDPNDIIDPNDKADFIRIVDLNALFLDLISIGSKRLSSTFFERGPYADTIAVVESAKTIMALEWPVLIEQIRVDGKLPRHIAFFAAVLEAQRIPEINELDATIASGENTPSPSSMNH